MCPSHPLPGTSLAALWKHWPRGGHRGTTFNDEHEETRSVTSSSALDVEADSQPVNLPGFLPMICNLPQLESLAPYPPPNSLTPDSATSQP